MRYRANTNRVVGYRSWARIGNVYGSGPSIDEASIVIGLPSLFPICLSGLGSDTYRADAHYPINADNKRLVRLTSTDGTFGNDPAKVNYYFGNLTERRVVWSRSNRDLMLSPKQDTEPVNALPKAHVEVDGKIHPEGAGWVRKLTYREP